MPQTKQVIIASEPYIDKLEQGAKLLEKWLIDMSTPPGLKRKAPAGEPRPRSQPQKNPMIEPAAVSIVPPIEIEDVKKQQEVAMSITETSSKIY